MNFTPVNENDVGTLIGLARAFHLEDGHPLDLSGETALLRIANGEPLARAWIIRDRNETIGYLVITLGFSVEYGSSMAAWMDSLTIFGFFYAKVRKATRAGTVAQV